MIKPQNPPWKNVKKKDTFNKEFDSWDYVIEGKTIDNRKLRIAVALIKPLILVVTAIDLGSSELKWKER